jgi:HEAT repeat protein
MMDLSKRDNLPVEFEPLLIGALKDPDESVRAHACGALQDVIPHDPKIISALTDAVRDKSEFVRTSAIYSLKQIGSPDASPAVPALIAALQDKKADVREGAAEALGKIGAVTPQVVPALIAALKDKNEEVRRAAATAFEDIGGVGNGKEAIPALWEVWNKDPDPFAKSAAGRALGKMGEKVKWE